MGMVLRWLILCDKQGVKLDPKLQYWEPHTERWIDVRVVECKVHEEIFFQGKYDW